MKKLVLIIAVLLYCGITQAQVHDATVYNKSKLTDSIVSGKGQLTIKSDSVFRVLAYAYFPYMFRSTGDNIFTGANTFSGNLTLSGLNTFSGVNTFNRKIYVDTILGTNVGSLTTPQLNITSADTLLINSPVKLVGNKTLSIPGTDKSYLTVLRNSSLIFKSSGNDTIGTGDNYGLFFKVNNSNKMKIDSLGKIKFYTSYLDFNNGNNATFGTVDDYSLVVKTSDSTRITIDSRGNITFPNRKANNGLWYRDGGRFMNTRSPHFSVDNKPDSVTSYNLAIGYDAGSIVNNFTAGTQGYAGNYNTGFGYNSLKSITIGYYNTGMGAFTGANITTGGGNFCLGAYTLSQVTTGSNNTGVGGEVMVLPGTSSTGNVFIGMRSGYGVSGTINYNTGVGLRAGFSLGNGGNYNTFIGSNSGEGDSIGTNNIFIGKYGNNSGGRLWGRTTRGSFNTLIGDTLKVFNTNGSIGLSNDSTASRHLNIASLFFARDTYTDTMKAGIGIRDDSVTARWHIKAGSTQRHTAPLKFNSGSLLTTTEVGAVEFLTDDLYYTQTTNTSRNRIAINRSDTLSTYASSVSVTMQGSLKQVTVSADCTLNATGGVAGSTMVLYLNCTAFADKVITFGTNFKSKGTVTLVVATAATNEATVTFVCLDGTNWIETARSVGM